ncbi:MAG: malate dehydrogenase [Gammaproteobacteria bacterium]|nr:MAG: malate dehydrogenase [Gammaproteobacteria bacterium]
MKKIAIFGAGRVGESTAQFLAREELAEEIVLVDIFDGVPQGCALDIQESAPMFNFDTIVRGDTDPGIIEGAGIVIITAGKPRKEGMSRSDLLQANMDVVGGLLQHIIKWAPDAILIMVTNPVDVLTYYASKITQWPKNRILGLSGVLDSGRMASFIAEESGFSSKDIDAMVLGGHGDAMVPVPQYTCVHGIPITELLDSETIDRINDRTRKGGAEIIHLKKTSSAYGAPAAAITNMVDAIVHDRRRILPCVAMLDNQYGQQHLCMGVPAILDRTGIAGVVELSLTDSQKQEFEKSAQMIRDDLKSVDLIE